MKVSSVEGKFIIVYHCIELNIDAIAIQRFYLGWGEAWLSLGHSLTVIIWKIEGCIAYSFEQVLKDFCFKSLVSFYIDCQFLELKRCGADGGG